MAAATTTIGVRANTTEYMRKMNMVVAKNKEAARTITGMVPGLTRMASAAGLAATAAQTMAGAWREVSARIRDAEGMLGSPNRRLASTLQGVGATQGDPQSFDRVMSAIATFGSAFGDRGDTAEQVTNKSIDAIAAFTDSLPSGADTGMIIEGFRQIAAFARGGADQNSIRTFARTLGIAAEVGFEGRERADIATLFSTSGAMGAQVFESAVGEYIRRLGTDESASTGGFLRFFEEEYPSLVRKREAQAAVAIQETISRSGIAGAAQRFAEATPQEFSSLRQAIDPTLQFEINKSRALEAEARRIISVEQQLQRLDIGPASSVLVGAERLLGGIDPATTPPRAITAVNDPDRMAQ